MTSPTELRWYVEAALREHRPPAWRVGVSSGAICCICNHPIPDSSIEYDLDFDSDHRTCHAHIECYALLERRVLGQSSDPGFSQRRVLPSDRLHARDEQAKGARSVVEPNSAPLMLVEQPAGASISIGVTALAGLYRTVLEDCLAVARTNSAADPGAEVSIGEAFSAAIPSVVPRSILEKTAGPALEAALRADAGQLLLRICMSMPPPRSSFAKTVAQAAAARGSKAQPR